jgi:hypothetical protein
MSKVLSTLVGSVVGSILPGRLQDRAVGLGSHSILDPHLIYARLGSKDRLLICEFNLHSCSQ